MSVEISVSHVRAVEIEQVRPYGFRAIKGAEWAHDEWAVTLTFQGRSLAVPFKTGIGWRRSSETRGYYGPAETAKRKIDAKSVLESLFGDASSAFETFESWCADLDFSSDSRKALDTYLACQRTAMDLRKLLGASYDAIEQEVRGD